jgi:hypothetical protein
MFTAGAFVPGATGRVQCTTGAPTAFAGGVPMDAGKLCVSADGVAATSFANGLGLVGSVVARTVAAPTFFANGMGFVANGGLAIDTAGAITGYAAGLPRIASGALAVDPTIT